MKNAIKKNVKIFWKGWGCSIFIAILITTSFKSAIADWHVVPTGSMKPTIMEGDRIFVNKLAYDLKIPYTTIHIAKWGEPQRGQIVVFYSPADGKRLVKRIVGVPGDIIEMHNNRLIINGTRIDYEPADNSNTENQLFTYNNDHLVFNESLNGARHPVMITPRAHAPRSFGPLIIPDGKFFMMGDNRDNSADSRYFGFVERSLVVGQATYVVISLDAENSHRPRWNRFFTKLP